MTASGHRVSFGGEKSVLKLDCNDGCTTPNIPKLTGEFPGGPVVRTWRFHCPGPSSIPGQGTKIQKKKKKGGQNKK